MGKKKRGSGAGASQLQMDWDLYQRNGWIENAEIPDGTAYDGSKVKADKIKSLLLKLNSHMGSNSECYPSQGLLAEKMSVSVRTVIRTVQAAQELSLLIVALKNRPGRKTVVNHYRIIWSELLLLDPDRARAFRDSVAADPRCSQVDRRDTPSDQCDIAPDQCDMVTDQCDMVTDQCDMVTDQCDTVSPELLTNTTRNNQENSPLRIGRTSPAFHRAADPNFDVVVVILKSLNVRAWRNAIAAAIDRGLTPAEVLALTETYKRLQPRDASVTPAYLYRWITGESEPPDDDEHAAAIPLPRQSPAEETLRFERVRSPVVKAGRRIGMDADQLREQLSQAFAREGFDPDSVPSRFYEV